MTHQELYERLPLRTIMNPEQLQNAIDVLNNVIDLTADEGMNDDESDYCNVLGLIIHDYESSSSVADQVPANEVVRILLEGSGLSQKEFGKLIGISATSIYDIVSGRRVISRKFRKMLAAHFKLNEEAFL